MKKTYTKTYCCVYDNEDTIEVSEEKGLTVFTCTEQGSNSTADIFLNKKDTMSLIKQLQEYLNEED